MYIWTVLYMSAVYVATSYGEMPPEAGAVGPNSQLVQVQLQPQAQPQPDSAGGYAGGYATSAMPYYEAGYGVQNPSVYDYMLAHNYPVVKSDPAGPVEYLSGVLPVFKQAMTTMLKAVGRLGLFLLGVAGVLLVGMAFTTAICTLTPLCTITFLNGYGLSEQTVRSLLTPDKITATAHLVQDAIHKYNQMQEAVNDP